MKCVVCGSETDNFSEEIDFNDEKKVLSLARRAGVGNVTFMPVSLGSQKPRNPDNPSPNFRPHLARIRKSVLKLECGVDEIGFYGIVRLSKIPGYEVGTVLRLKRG